MRDAIVFPREIVQPLAYEAAVSLIVFDARDLAIAGGEQEYAGLARREIGLKQEFLVFSVIVGINGLNEQVLIGTFGADVDLAHVVNGQQGVQFGGLKDNGLCRARQIDGVANRDGGAGRGGERGRERPG